MAAAAPQAASDVTCVLIPVRGTQLLLPNVTVAEILPWRRVKRLENMPDWFVGLLAWRGETVPVVQYSVLNGAAPDGPAVGRSIIVMNRVRGNRGAPFYGILAEALPRLMHIGEDDIDTEKAPLGQAEVAAVSIGADRAVIPNLTFIEEQLRELKTR